VIIGPRRVTIVYATANGKVTGSTGKILPLMRTLKHLHEFIALHATVGARVTIVHHSDGFIGTVRKTSGQYMPVETIAKRPLVKLPPQVNLQRTAVLACAKLANWSRVEKKLLSMMDTKKVKLKVKTVPKVKKEKEREYHQPATGWWSVGWTNRGKHRYACKKCGAKTVRPAIYTREHPCDLDE
jgi:hypothetical protein